MPQPSLASVPVPFISTVPVMLGNNLSATHGSWIGSIKDPYMVAVTGWMRAHLMGDTAGRTMGDRFPGSA